jgi:hypothetical protein
MVEESCASVSSALLIISAVADATRRVTGQYRISTWDLKSPGAVLQTKHKMLVSSETPA